MSSMKLALQSKEVAARFILKPNRINLEGEHPFLLGTTWHQIKDYAQFIPRDDVLAGTLRFFILVSLLMSSSANPSHN